MTVEYYFNNVKQVASPLAIVCLNLLLKVLFFILEYCQFLGECNTKIHVLWHSSHWCKYLDEPALSTQMLIQLCSSLACDLSNYIGQLCITCWPTWINNLRNILIGSEKIKKKELEHILGRFLCVDGRPALTGCPWQAPSMWLLWESNPVTTWLQTLDSNTCVESTVMDCTALVI